MNIKELRQKKADLQAKKLEQKAKYDKLATALTDGGLNDEQRTEFESVKAETEKINQRITDVEAMIAEYEELAEAERNSAATVIDSGLEVVGGIPAQPKKPIFSSFGEQLRCIVSAYQSKMKDVDPRLIEVERQAAAAGGAAAVGADGGFLIQSDFATEIMKKANTLGQFTPRCRQATISSNADKLVMPYIDETSRATGSRWGGVQVYWANEADTATAKKPKIGKLEINLNKLIGIAYMTRELIEDASAMDSIYRDAFAEEISFIKENAVLRGTGAGQPQGILNAAALISIAKETGQDAATILYENIIKMYSRIWPGSLSKAEWFINPDVIPQLLNLNTLVGVGGVPVFLPPGNSAANAPYGTLLGRPIVPTEYNPTLGTVGDIMLTDFSHYQTVEKGGLRVDMSEHVNFTSDEIALRFVTRFGGSPLWQSAVTPFQGSDTKSPYLALATRS